MTDKIARKALVVLSGGQDSTTCLFWAKLFFEEIHAVTFDYGQRHIREIDAARMVADLAMTTSHEVVDIGSILESTSPLTDHSQPLEQYESFEEMDKIIGDRIELTFVPMRNALFLTLAANRAVCLGIKDVVTGVCQMDNANYPDCRRSFIDVMEATIDEALGAAGDASKRMFIHTPLMEMSKAESVRLAIDTPGAYAALAHSHTAYDGSYPPSGRDHATVLRAQGFEEAMVPDPLIMRAHSEGLLSALPTTDNYSEQVVEWYHKFTKE